MLQVRKSLDAIDRYVSILVEIQTGEVREARNGVIRDSLLTLKAEETEIGQRPDRLSEVF